MRIYMVGGGSGGHVTPLKAVALEILKQDPTHDITVITDRRFQKQAGQIFADMPAIHINTIFAGKFRRYNTKSALWHVLHLPTLLKNIGDVFLLLLGTLQMTLRFLFRRPEVVFCKGGFVSVPVGVAAHMYKVPLVIHDSDTHPGLSSRIIARWARKIATGMPVEYYTYPAEKLSYTGIPVDAAYKPILEDEQQEAKRALGYDADQPLVLVTGGGTGAERLNKIIERGGEGLLKQGWQICLITGVGKAQSVNKVKADLAPDQAKKWQVHEFVRLRDYILAADVVVTRTGATTMQELANARKTVITVPSKYLTGGHQLKNAQMFEEAGAAYVLDEEKLELQPDMLSEALATARLGIGHGNQMAKTLHEQFARPHASEELASMILGSALKQ